MKAIGFALQAFDFSLSILFSLFNYVPAVIGSAIILFFAVYAVRFLLLK